MAKLVKIKSEEAVWVVRLDWEVSGGSNYIVRKTRQEARKVKKTQKWSIDKNLCKGSIHRGLVSKEDGHLIFIGREVYY